MRQSRRGTKRRIRAVFERSGHPGRSRRAGRRFTHNRRHFGRRRVEVSRALAPRAERCLSIKSHRMTTIASSSRLMGPESQYPAGTCRKKTRARQMRRQSANSAGKPIVIENVLEVIEAATGQQIAIFKPPVVFDNLAISPDNQFLAAELPNRPGVVYALHLPTRKSKELKTDLRRIVPGGMVFSKDSRSIHLVAPDRLKTVALGNGESKDLKYEIPSPIAVYSAETNLLAVGVVRSKQGRPEVQIYDVAEGKQTEQLAVPSAPTYLGFSPDGGFLAATVVGGSIRAWQTSDWTVTATVAARFRYVPGQLAVSAEAQHVAVRPPRGAGRDEMRVIDLDSGETVQSIDTRDVFFMPSGTLAIANNAGPFYMEVGGGSITEYPGGDAALVQASDSGEAVEIAATASASPQGGYGLPSRETPVRVGYGLPAASREAAAPPVEETPAPEPAAPVIVGYGAPSGGSPGAVASAGVPQRKPGQWLSLTSEELPPESSNEMTGQFWRSTHGSLTVSVSGNGSKLVRTFVASAPNAESRPGLDYFDLTNGQRINGTSDTMVRSTAWSSNGKFLAVRTTDRRCRIVARLIEHMFAPGWAPVDRGAGRGRPGYPAVTPLGRRR